MKIVIDTNILFSFFWKDSFTKKLILNSNLELIAPEYALTELKKYEKEIIVKTRITEKEFSKYLNEINKIIKFIKKENYSDCLAEARNITLDKKDADFVATAIKLDCPIWSNDSQLKNQDRVKVLNTSQIINNL